MIRLIRGSLLLIIEVLCLTVHAESYYVSPTGGNDLNKGTIDQPWATWQKAFNTASAGDTVFFRGGTWYPTRQITVDFSSHNGTHDNPICFINYPGEKPVLDCINHTSTGTNGGMSVLNPDHIKFIGLTVCNVPCNNPEGQWIAGIGISNAGTLWLDQVVSHGHAGRGMRIEGWDTLFMTNCDSYNNYDSIPYGAGIPGGAADGFVMVSGGTATDTLKIAYISGCRAWNNSDDGFDISSPKQLDFHDNWAWANGRGYGDACGFKWRISHLRDKNKRKIYNNLSAYNYNYSESGSLIGGGQVWTNLNNLGEWDEENAGPYNVVYNNTSYKDAIGFTSTAGNFNVGINSDWSVKNNLVHSPISETSYARLAAFRHNNFLYPIDVDQSNNSWVQDGNTHYYTKANPDYVVTDADFVSLDSSQLSLPRKQDGSLPDITFLKLKQTSDLIDAGVKIGLPFSGSAPDIGYSEYEADSVAPAIPVFVAAIIQNDTPSSLEIAYSLSLANIIPSPSTFTVKVNNTALTVSSVYISDTKVILTLSKSVAYGDVITLSYSKPLSNPLQTPNGGQAATYEEQAVINNCAQTVNAPPIVAISSPIKSSSFIEPATITIDAAASDPDGSISSVEFYNGSIKLGESTKSPYSFTWKEVFAGTYSLSAVATDNLNAKTVSAIVNVVVEKSNNTFNQAPIVTIIKPLIGSKIKKHDNVLIEVAASDPDGTINGVILKSGDSILVELSKEPYTYLINNIDTGTYFITAIAIDNLGAREASSVLKLEVYELLNTDLISLPLYPNPNNGHFSVDIESSFIDERCKLAVVNLNGNILYNNIITEPANNVEVDLPNLSPGTYILMVINGNKIVATSKFIKK